MGEAVVNAELLDRLIAEASASGGSELANYQLFVERLCVALALPRPAMASEQNHLNDYVFERRVDFKHPDGTPTAGRIDCYRRNCFVLEAKQSAKRTPPKLDVTNCSSFQRMLHHRKPGQALRGTRGWTKSCSQPANRPRITHVPCPSNTVTHPFCSWWTSGT